jgi:hypothetical protein
MFHLSKFNNGFVRGKKFPVEITKDSDKTLLPERV